MIPVDKVVCVRRHARNDERYNYRLKLTNAVHTLKYFSGITHEEIAIQGERKTPQQRRLRNSGLWIN